MKLQLRVDIDGLYFRGGAIVEVPEMLCKHFQPLKSCDDRMLSFITGDVMEEEAVVVMKLREDAASILSKELAQMIVAEMRKMDTHNGYNK